MFHIWYQLPAILLRTTVVVRGESKITLVHLTFDVMHARVMSSERNSCFHVERSGQLNPDMKVNHYLEKCTRVEFAWNNAVTCHKRHSNLHVHNHLFNRNS
jgi:hypothetical protein